jgi:capsular exopolysaccharide synthesis family protein
MNTVPRVPPQSYRRPGPGAPAPVDEEIIRASDLLDAVRRRWGILVLCMLTGILLAAIYIYRTHPVYEASAALRIDERRSNLPTVYTTSHDADAVLTEVEVLRARELAAETVDSLGLRAQLVSPPRGITRTTVFSRVSVTPSADTGRFRLSWTADGRRIDVSRVGSAEPIASLRPAVPGAFAGISITIAEGGTIPTEPLDLRVWPRESTIDDLREAVQVGRVGLQTNVIHLRYDDIDPLVAQRVIDSYIAGYLARRQHTQRTEARSTSAFLRAQIDTLNRELRASEQAFQSFRESARVVNPETEATTQVSRLAQLQAERAALDGERQAFSELMTDARRVAGRVQQGEPSPYRRVLGFPTLLRNTATSQLLSNLNEVEDQRTLLLTRRTVNDPDVQILTNRITQLERQIEGVATTYLAGLTAQVAANDQTLATFGAQLAQVPQREIEFARLQRQPLVLSQLVTTLQTRLKETQIAEAVEDPTVQVIDQSSVTPDPVKPRPSLALAFGLFAGTLIGAAGVGVRERADRAIRSRSDVAFATGAPVLGVVPNFKSLVYAERASRAIRSPGAANASRAGRGGLRPIRDIENKDAGASLLPVFGESYAQIYLNLVGRPSPKGAATRSILVTSPLPGDGKTLTAINLAITLARRGIRTVLVDADLRRGSIDSYLRVPGTPGLGEVLSGRATLEEVLQRASVGDKLELTYLTAGTSKENAGYLLSLDSMRVVHDTLRNAYQVVILDTPPLGIVSDAAALSMLVDKVILVARANATPREALEFAAEELWRLGAPLVGSVLNDIDARKEVGYGHYGHYAYGKYAKAAG